MHLRDVRNDKIQIGSGRRVVAALAHYGRILEEQDARPIIAINRRVAHSFLSGAPTTYAIVRRMVQLLNNYPHFFVLRGPPPVENTQLTGQICRAIAGFSECPSQDDQRHAVRLSQTRVEIDPDADLSTSVTRYSRTHLALKLHTDSSYQPVPHNLVAFQMVRPAVEGGETILAAIEDIGSALDRPEIVSLHKQQIPFGRRQYPIFWRQRGRSHIRFYDQQIMSALKMGSVLNEDARRVLRPLMRVLKTEGRNKKFSLQAGETLFLHNTLVLHGRTAFDPNSHRLMLRVRTHAECLA